MNMWLYLILKLGKPVKVEVLSLLYVDLQNRFFWPVHSSPHLWTEWIAQPSVWFRFNVENGEWPEQLHAWAFSSKVIDENVSMNDFVSMTLILLSGAGVLKEGFSSFLAGLHVLLYRSCSVSYFHQHATRLRSGAELSMFSFIFIFHIVQSHFSRRFLFLSFDFFFFFALSFTCVAKYS